MPGSNLSTDVPTCKGDGTAVEALTVASFLNPGTCRRHLGGSVSAEIATLLASILMSARVPVNRSQGVLRKVVRKANKKPDAFAPGSHKRFG